MAMSPVLFVVALRGHCAYGRILPDCAVCRRLIAVLLLDEPVAVQLIAAGSLMALGVWLYLTERHTHAAMEHEHEHTHDEHQQHARAGTSISRRHSYSFVLA